jgi:hypothetical protein
MYLPGPAAHLFHGLSDKKILRCDLAHLDVDDRSLAGASHSSVNRNTSMYHWLACANYPATYQLALVPLILLQKALEDLLAMCML